jgi:hypothetical protein
MDNQLNDWGGYTTENRYKVVIRLACPHQTVFLLANGMFTLDWFLPSSTIQENELIFGELISK